MPAEPNEFGRLFAPGKIGSPEYRQWMRDCAKEMMEETSTTGDQEFGEGVEWLLNRLAELEEREKGNAHP